MRVLLLLALLGCSNDVDPRVIPGGGVGDGEIDGEVNVFVLDDVGDTPLSGATVAIGETEKTTDAKGLVTFPGVEGAQTIAVKMTGYRSAVWVNVNGANVTIGLKGQAVTPPHASLSGTIAGWDQITVPQGHAKIAGVFYSQSDGLGDAANNLDQMNGNNCIGATCAFTAITRTGPVTLVAIILDRDLKGTPLMPDDDTQTIIGWAYKTGIMVEDGVNQSGLSLTQVEAGNLETVSIEYGTPPAGLPQTSALVGIEIGKDETVQIPVGIESMDATTVLVPKRTVFGANATYRLTAIAQTTSADAGAQAIVLRHGLTTASLAAGTWLVPPTGVAATHTTASYEPVSGAKLHSVRWDDATGELLEITVFDSKTKAVEVPNVVALPSSGTLTAHISAIGVDFDVNDFSLEDDSDLLWGLSAQPVNVP